VLVGAGSSGVGVCPLTITIVTSITTNNIMLVLVQVIVMTLRSVITSLMMIYGEAVAGLTMAIGGQGGR